MKVSTNLVTLVLLVTLLICFVSNHRGYAQPMTQAEAAKYIENILEVGVKDSTERITPSMRRVIATPNFAGGCPNGERKGRRGRCRYIFV